MNVGSVFRGKSFTMSILLQVFTRPTLISFNGSLWKLVYVGIWRWPMFCRYPFCYNLLALQIINCYIVQWIAMRIRIHKYLNKNGQCLPVPASCTNWLKIIPYKRQLIYVGDSYFFIYIFCWLKNALPKNEYEVVTCLVAL